MENIPVKGNSSTISSYNNNNNNNNSSNFWIKTKALASEFSRRCRRLFGSNLEEQVQALRTIGWVAVVTICAYFTAVQSAECVEKLKHPPSTTKTYLNTTNKYIEYPAVTFCFKNSKDQGYDLRILRYFNISGYWINVRFDEASDYREWEDFAWEYSDLTDVWRWSTFRFHDGFYSECGANETDDGDVRPSDMPTESRIVSYATSLNANADDVVHDWRYFYDHGLCRTYMPREGSEEPMSGEWNGYQFHFRYYPCQEGENSDSVSPMLPGGMDVFVHDAKEWWTENPSFFYNGENLFIHNGIEAYIKLSETHYSGLDKEESPCQTQEDAKTSYSECLEKCRWNFLASMPIHRCSAPFMPVMGFNDCGNFNSTTSLFNLYQQWSDPASTAHCKDHCILPCQFKSYMASVLKEETMDFFQNIFHIYYPTSQFQNLVEELTYDSTSFIADMGGSLGFLLGLSVLSAVEIAEWVVFTSVNLIKKWRKKRMLLKLRKNTGM